MAYDPTEYLSPLDCAGAIRLSKRYRGTLFNSLVRTRNIVVIVDVLMQNSMQMGSVQNEDLIQTFLSN
jgi:hypothetical protein